MTGYGKGAASFGTSRVVVSIRALNHRFFDIRLRVGQALQEHGVQLERRVRDQLERGRIEVQARIEGGDANTMGLDKERARTLLQELAELRDEVCPGEALPASLLTQAPDLFQAREEVDQAELTQAIHQACDQACSALSEMRDQEGASLKRVLKEQLAQTRALIAALAEQAQELSQAYRERLRKRVHDLLKDQDAQLEPGRLEQEVAIFADRSDIAEELARLESHSSQFEALLDQDQAYGRKLDFLLQEMAREANTIGAKIQDVSATRHVIDLKASLEQMREQAQNVL